jgi:hypothetical protein
MLHFNNNEDTDRLQNDSLHKIRPLLNIVKKKIGQYAELGSEFSFDEATMACYSRYARNLVSFNPMKPTGKLHFMMYMLCCAVTNLTLKLRIHTKQHSEQNDYGNEKTQLTKLDNLTSDMCKVLYNSGSTVNMDNYYMSTTCALHLKNDGVYCRGTIRSNQKFVPKSTLFTPAEAISLPRGTIRYAVNPTHNIIAVGWLDNKVVNFISTADTTTVKTVKRRVTDSKVEVAAPEIIANYNKYMGGVDQHDRLWSSFSLGKAHKFKKYYIKLLLFVMDVAFTNSWVYYSLANPEDAKKEGARANFFRHLEARK